MVKKRLLSRKYAFTLVELIFVAIIIGLIMPQMFSLYNFIIKSNKEVVARQQAIQQWYEFFERLNILMEDYTVDYEEYYNRQMVWCVWTNKRWNNFDRNIWMSGYCTNFTAYGNENGNLTQSGSEKYHNLYYCSSKQSQWGDLWHTRVIHPFSSCGTIGSSFWNSTRQSYGQYAALFIDVKGGEWDIVWDNDDEELWYLVNAGIDAIGDPDDIQELYLISHDWTRRLYFRRKLDREYEDENWKKYKQYKIQMLRLRWFDAWRMHNFSTDSQNKWLYDWVIDTWACDYSMWFEWHGNVIDAGWAYSGYHLPQDENDCRLDLTQWTTNLFAWNIAISPRWDADLYWAKRNRQVNSYMKIMIINKIYFPSIYGSSSRIADTVKDFSVPLETTINMKDFYRG